MTGRRGLGIALRRELPARDESVRAVLLRVSRAGRRLTTPVEAAAVDNEVYFKLARQFHPRA